MTEPLWVAVHKDKALEAFDWITERGGWGFKTTEEIATSRQIVVTRLEEIIGDHIPKFNIDRTILLKNDKLLFKLIFGGMG